MDNSIIKQLEELSEKCTTALEELEDGHLYSDEAYDLMEKVKSFLKTELQPDSKEFRIYDKLKWEISI
jgi:hypothetical protein